MQDRAGTPGDLELALPSLKHLPVICDFNAPNVD